MCTSKLEAVCHPLLSPIHDNSRRVIAHVSRKTIKIATPCVGSLISRLYLFLQLVEHLLRSLPIDWVSVRVRDVFDELLSCC